MRAIELLNPWLTEEEKLNKRKKENWKKLLSKIRPFYCMFTDTLILQLVIILDNFYMMVFSRIAQFSLLPYRSFLGYTKQFCFSLFFASRHGCFSFAYNLNSPMLNFKKSLLSFLFYPEKHPYFITLALYFRERRRVYPGSSALISAPDFWPVRTRKWAINNETGKCFYFILFTSAVTLLGSSLYSLSVVVERVRA